MWQDSLRDFLCLEKINFAENAPMSEITSMRCGGEASFCIVPGSVNELLLALRFLKLNNIKFKVVGGMTNTLPCDEKFEGALVRTVGIDDVEITNDNVVRAGTGVILGSLVRSLASSGIGGLEEFSGIPGTVGGAAFGNSGAHSKSISEVILSVLAYDIHTDETRRLDVSLLGYGYRQSIFKKEPGLVILQIELRGVKKSSAEIFDSINEFARYRREHQPLSMHSLGSIFKHPAGDFAPRLIESLSLKGLSVGGAEVSKKHAGFIVNTGYATSSDVKCLIKLIKEKVFFDYNIILEEEINIM